MSRIIIHNQYTSFFWKKVHKKQYLILYKSIKLFFIDTTFFYYLCHITFVGISW